MKNAFYICCVTLLIMLRAPNVHAQMNVYVDPALAYNKIMGNLDNAMSYRQIGNFKVKGTPYLYAETVTGDVYYGKQVAKNVAFKIDNYAKTLELPTETPGKYFVVSSLDLDSFIIRAKDNQFINQDIKFVSSKIVGSSEKQFLQAIYQTPNRTLYKAFTTDMEIVSDNYVQSDLREFKTQVVYHFTDANMPGLNSIKPAKGSFKKVFKSERITNLVSDISFMQNSDIGMIKAFTVIDNEK